MGGEFGGEWIHMYGQLGAFTIHLKPSQRCLLTGYTPTQIKSKKKKYHVKSVLKIEGFQLQELKTEQDSTKAAYYPT